MATKRASSCLPRGLKNLGNTCFLNAVLQSLTSIRSFHIFLEKRSARLKDIPVTTAIKTCIRELSKQNYEGAYAPELSEVAHLQRFMSTKEQQDAQELFQYLLSALEEEDSPASKMSTVEVPLSLSTSPPKHEHNPFLFQNVNQLTFMNKAIRDLNHVGGELPENMFNNQRKPMNPFSGLLASVIECNECGVVRRVRYEKFIDISLPIPPPEQRRSSSVTIDDCLRSYTAPEIIDTGVCGYKICTNTKAKKWLAVGQCPHVLCLHVQRATGTTSKCNDHILFGETLDLAPYCAQTSHPKLAPPAHRCDQDDAGEASAGGMSYRLVAVIVHQGCPSNGHFATYRRPLLHSRLDHANDWVYINDAHCETVPSETVFGSNAYMLFYEREAHS